MESLYLIFPQNGLLGVAGSPRFLKNYRSFPIGTEINFSYIFGLWILIYCPIVASLASFFVQQLHSAIFLLFLPKNIKPISSASRISSKHCSQCAFSKSMSNFFSIILNPSDITVFQISFCQFVGFDVGIVCV